VVAAIILVSIGTTNYQTMRQALVEQAQAQAQSLAGQSAETVNSSFAPLAAVPQTIAGYEDRIIDIDARIVQLRESLPAILERFPSAVNIYLYFEPNVIPGQQYSGPWYSRMSGKVQVAFANFPGEPGYDPTKELYDYHSQDWYTRPRDAGGLVWIEPYFDAATNAAIVTASAPVYSTDKFIGVVGIDLNLTKVQQIVADIHPTPGSYALLIGPQGAIIANPAWKDSVLNTTIADLAAKLNSPDLANLGTAMTSGKEGVIAVTDPKSGTPAWAAYHPIASTGWSVAVITPQADLLTGIDRLQTRVIFLGVAGLLVLALVLFFLASSLTRPLTQLTRAAETMAHGNLQSRVNIARRDEIGVLAQSFNGMADALQERMQAEQEARAEALRLQQLTTEGRQVFEAAVADYLSVVQQVARGDLTQRVEVIQQGALGQLGQGLNGMVESLHELTSQVHTANESIVAAAAEILAATTQQGASAAEQSAAVTQTTTTIEEVKAIAQQTAQQASQVAHDSQAMLEAAQQGTQVVEETVGGMGQIRVRVESIARTILTLSEQTQAISTIITTVSELADQSNLLALNAAIEAARAGEQGKGFSVVAQHVRELAERSKLATTQVRELLGEIQRSTNAAVLVTEEGTKGVEAGGKLAGQAGQVIRRIALEVESGSQANAQIAAAAQQQMAGMSQIGHAMSSIQQANNQALASIRQAERAAQDLHALAQSLRQTVAIYRLKSA
jgi:methyl-accepting chemotaxis protein